MCSSSFFLFSDDFWNNHTYNIKNIDQLFKQAMCWNIRSEALAAWGGFEGDPKDAICLFQSHLVEVCRAIRRKRRWTLHHQKLGKNREVVKLC